MYIMKAVDLSPISCIGNALGRDPFHGKYGQDEQLQQPKTVSMYIRVSTVLGQTWICAHSATRALRKVATDCKWKDRPYSS